LKGQGDHGHQTKFPHGGLLKVSKSFLLRRSKGAAGHFTSIRGAWQSAYEPPQAGQYGQDVQDGRGLTG